MIPYFNTSGPCAAGEHSMLAPERRLAHVMELVEQHRYFTLHAGRQTGKTTCARWLVDHYNHEGRFAALWVDLQTARDQPDPALALRTILSLIESAARLALPAIAPAADQTRSLADPSFALVDTLRDLAVRAGKPLVILFDEADGLVGPAMVSFLTQLRRGYIDRDRTPFPASVGLVGMCRVRGYSTATGDRDAAPWVGTTSPYNIAEPQTLAPFTAADVVELLAQHTAATGQRFEPAAAALIHELSAGHPWLVNALADQLVHDVADLAVAITAAHVEEAKTKFILERRTHLESLAALLCEPRVQRVIEPMLVGGWLADGIDDDLEHVVGLGLIKLAGGEWRVANPICREVIPRALTQVLEAQLPQDQVSSVRPDGSLDLGKLLAAFQQFWREDGHVAAQGFTYREAGPHLMATAFLQRAVSGGGRIEHEYGFSRRRLDLLIEWRGQRHLVEVKLRRDAETEDEALEQITRYLDGAGIGEGWLVLFDLRASVPWAEKLTTRVVERAGKRITVVGC